MNDLDDMNKDVFQIYLDSDNRDGGVAANANYNLYFPNKKDNYKKFVMYIDNLQLDTLDRTNQTFALRMNVYQSNSYNSLSKGNNDIVATIFAPNIASSRTIDNSLAYQAPTKPIYIDNFPDVLQLRFTTALNNTTLDFTTDDNVYSLQFRIEAYY